VRGRGTAPLLEAAGEISRERRDCRLAAVTRDPPQRRVGQVVIRVRAAPEPANVGQCEHLGRATPPAGAEHVLLAAHDLALEQHRVQVFADCGRTQAERLTELTRGGAAVREQMSLNPGAGTAVAARRSHVGRGRSR
jgi:hypothetical protein